MSGLFGGAPQASAPYIPPAPALPAPAPEAPDPVVMPEPDAEAQKRSQARMLAKRRSRSTTRMNTILGSEDNLGGE